MMKEFFPTLWRFIVIIAVVVIGLLGISCLLTWDNLIKDIILTFATLAFLLLCCLAMAVNWREHGKR